MGASSRAGVLALVAGLLVGGLAAAEDGGVLGLAVGTQRVLSVPGVTRIAVGDGAVADVRTLEGGQVLIIGQAEGTTSLLVWRAQGARRSYTVRVRKRDPAELAEEVHQLLGEVPGVSVRVVEDRIYLDGQAYTARDAERIEQVLALYPAVKSFVRVAQDARKAAADYLNAAYQRAGLPNVVATAVGSALLLEGSVESAQQARKAELIAQALGEKVDSLLTVGLRRMVLAEVQILEVRRSARGRVGLRYPTDVVGRVEAQARGDGTLTGPLTSGVQVGVQAGADFALGFQLNDGEGRLLAQTRLVCASGERAEFLAGGQVPIPVVTQSQFKVEYKPYGVILGLKAEADAQGTIQAELDAEASEVDTSVAVSGGTSGSVPGFRTRKVHTTVTVRHGETIVLSGLTAHDAQKAVSKLPGLGQVPLLGELFKSRALDAQDRELLIFVTPRVVTPGSARVRESVEGAQQRYRDASGAEGPRLLD